MTRCRDLQLVHFSPENSSDSWYQSALTVEGKLSNLELVYSGASSSATHTRLPITVDYSVFYDRGTAQVSTGPEQRQPDHAPGAGQQPARPTRSESRAALQHPRGAARQGAFGVFIQRQLHNILEQYTMPGYAFVNPYGSR